MVCAWRRRNGWHLERNADRDSLPATPDCRGGVFATRRFPRPSPHVSPCPPFPRPLPIKGRRGVVCRDVACRVAILTVLRRV